MILLYNLLGLILLGYVSINVYIWNNRRKVKHFPSIPCEKGLLWFRGCIFEIIRRKKVFKEAGNAVPLNFLEIMIDISKENQWDHFVAPLFFINLLFVQDLGSVSQVLPDRINFNKTPAVNRLFSKIGNARIFGQYGLLNDPGTELWAAKRRTMDPAFHRNFLRTIMHQMNQVTENLIRNLEVVSANGEVFDITTNYNRTALEAISVCGFDWSMDMIEKHGDEIIKTTDYLFGILQIAFEEQRSIGLPWCRREEKAELSRRLNPMRNLVRDHLQARIDEMNSGNAQEQNILSYIIRANQVSDDLTIENIVDEYLTFLVAGMETTSITLAMATFYMSVYPEVLDRAKEEVERVLGDRETIEFDDLSELKYLEQIVRETLRLKPPARSTGRIVVKNNVFFGDQHIPKDTILMIPTMAIQVDPRYWEDPLTFNPDRFDPSVKRQNYTFMPFMLGPRNCVGKNFAMLEMKVVLAKVIQNFDLVNPNPEVKDLVMLGKITARPLDGVKLMLKQWD